MKWMTMAAITLALLFVCVFLVINKQEQLSVITNEVQTYMGQRDTLQKEVGDLQGHRDRRAALDKEWEEFKTKEGELKGKYGEKLTLEGECATLMKKRDGLATDIKVMEDRVVLLQGRVAELANQTNFLGKTMDRIRGERDAILEDTKAARETQDKVKEQRVAEEARYAKQKLLADQEAVRAANEKNRADEAKRRADDAVRHKEDSERAAEKAETAYEARITAARAKADKDIAEQEKRMTDAHQKAAKAMANAEAEEARLKTLATEVAKLEARRDELAGVEKRLDETKEALAEEQAKLGQTRAKVSAQQVTAQIDGVREDVTKRLDAFKAKLDELEKKQKEEVKQGGL